MLGLGDIIIPGLFLAFLFNLDKALKVKGEAYFRAGMIAYGISFLQCAAVIIIFDSAQPVLLYIVPCLFVSTGITAMSRNEWS